MAWYSLLPNGNRSYILDLIPKNKFKRLSLIEAGLYTVNYICENYPPPYTLCLSGGLDSQVSLYVWKLSGKPFNTITVTYNDNLNYHDISYMLDYSKSLNVELTVKNLDLINFLENDLSNYAIEYSCSSPQICTHMRIAKEITDGTIIFSGNCITEFSDILDYVKLGIYRYSLSSKCKVIPYFLLETPEIAYSIYEPKINLDTGKRFERVEIYKSEGIPIIIPPSKYTGFETIRKMYEEKDYPIQTKLKYFSHPYRMKFDLLFRIPYEKIIGKTAVKNQRIQLAELPDYYI